MKPQWSIGLYGRSPGQKSNDANLVCAMLFFRLSGKKIPRVGRLKKIFRERVN
jgi:hypothetical protein